MDLAQLRAMTERNGSILVDSNELKNLIDELAAHKTKGLDVMAENNVLKAKIEEYELAIIRGIEQLKESMREILIKMHTSHELLREAKKFVNDVELTIEIDALLSRDGISE